MVKNYLWRYAVGESVALFSTVHADEHGVTGFVVVSVMVTLIAAWLTAERLWREAVADESVGDINPAESGERVGAF